MERYNKETGNTNMKLLYIYSTDINRDNYITLVHLGYTIEEYTRKLENSRLNDEEIELLVKYAKAHGITHLMSTHLIYNVAVAAYRADIKYIAIIWDAPYIKMYTPFGKLDNCWFSVFDKLDAERFRAAGLKHILYQPLAVNPDDIYKWKLSEEINGKYYNDICFVGSLYSENAYDKELRNIPVVLQQYFESIFEEAAFKWDGINRIYGKTSMEMIRYMQMAIPEFSLDNIYDLEDNKVFEINYLVRKLANIERTCVLNMLAEYFDVTCHTYQGKGTESLSGVRIFPPVAYGEAMSNVFARSKINLNISLKGIEGGTPKRVMDICGAGGFALTNYCEETAELFKEDEEIVMFKTPEELLDKVHYYLDHDDKRKVIARRGQEKVLQNYTYEKQLRYLMQWIADETNENR